MYVVSNALFFATAVTRKEHLTVCMGCVSGMFAVHVCFKLCNSYENAVGNA